MKTQFFQFTLVLKNVDDTHPDLEDSLFEAGCDDALVHFRNGAVYLEFDRKALSLEEAVISAIKDVQSSSVEAEVASIGPENLVTESEMAKRLEVSRQTVSLWISGKRRKSFPKPVMRLSEKSPLWNWSEVVHWLYKNNIIQDYSLVENALFFSNINAALEERDSKTREIRQHFVERIAFHGG
jgi:predicted DNA-binding transcriptional regulator AlpA